MTDPDTRPERRSGSPQMRRIRAVSFWSLLVGAVVFALTFGLGTGVVVAAVFGAAYKGVERAFGSRIEEHVARQPELRLAIASGGDLVQRVEALVQPWPFDLDQIITNEITRLIEEGDAYDSMARKPAQGLIRAADPFVLRPREEDYDAALERFRDQVSEYECDLRKWLVSYRETAEARSRTFELALRVTNGSGAAYAEDVKLAIDLPDDAEVVEDWPTVSPQPEAPAYVPPKPRSLHDLSPRTLVGTRILPAFSMPADVSLWQTRTDGRRVVIGMGSIHHDATVEVSDRLLVRVAGEGTHSLRWTLFTKNGRRHCNGTLELVVLPRPSRPAFTKLYGIESYSDVPVVDEEGKTVRQVRMEDPPATPPDSTSSGPPLDRIRHIAAYNEWSALGLAARKHDNKG